MPRTAQVNEPIWHPVEVSVTRLQDMKSTQTIQKLEAQIARIKTQLQRHGAMRPGSLSRQYNVLQTGLPLQRSHASAPARPLLPTQLRLSREKDLIRREILGQVRTELANYKKFRRLI